MVEQLSWTKFLGKIYSLEELSWTEILGKIYSLEELSSTEILGQIRIKYPKEVWEMTIKILSQKTRRKLEILMSTCPASNQGCTRTAIQLKTLQTRILKMETDEKCWPHRCMRMGRGEKYGSSHRPIASGMPEAKTIQKRETSAQRTQADALSEIIPCWWLQSHRKIHH